MSGTAPEDQKPAGRFIKGGKPGPGRPVGAKNKATLAMEKLLDGEAEAIARKAIDLALAGDGAALRLCMDRLLPPRRDRYVTFDLPEINSAADAVKATAAILSAVSAGEITPQEAAELGKLIEGYVKTLEASELEERIMRLEQRTSI